MTTKVFKQGAGPTDRRLLITEFLRMSPLARCSAFVVDRHRQGWKAVHATRVLVSDDEGD